MKLEDIVSSKTAGFGLDISPMQVAICRVLDGTPLGELASADGVREMLGCDPSELTGAPLEAVILGPVRCGKTIIDCANAIRLSQTVDVSNIKAGEDPPRITALSTSVDTSKAFHGHLVGTLKGSKVLRKLIVGEPVADSVFLRHPSGLVIEVKIAAAHRGGYSLASRWQAGIFFQESPGWYSTDRIVSLEENRETALGRILPGGQIVYSGSPWAPSGFCFETYKKSFGMPTKDLAVMRAGPAWLMNPQYWTPERVAHIKRTSPRTYKMHLLAEFGSAQNAAFDYEEALACFGDLPPGYVSARPFGILDPSSLRGDDFVAAIASFEIPTGQKEPIWHVAEGCRQYIERDEYGYEQFHPAPTRPVLRIHQIMTFSPKGEVTTVADVVASISREFRRYGVDAIFSDQRDEATLAGLFSQHGFRKFTSYAWTAESKVQAVTTLRRMMTERSLSIIPHPKMREQVLAYGYTLQPGGGYRYQGRGAHDVDAAILVTLAHSLNDAQQLGVTQMDTKIDGAPARMRQGQGHVIRDYDDSYYPPGEWQ